VALKSGCSLTAIDGGRARSESPNWPMQRISFAKGYVEALNSDPQHYLAYRKEQQAKLGR
jgi:hypothetical protein